MVTQRQTSDSTVTATSSVHLQGGPKHYIQCDHISLGLSKLIIYEAHCPL